jgi:hypothetical protein
VTPRPRVWADDVSRADPRHAIVLDWLERALLELDPHPDDDLTGHAQRARYRADHTMAIELTDEGRIRILAVPDAGPGFLEVFGDLRAPCDDDTGAARMVLRAHTTRAHPPVELLELLIPREATR